MFEIFTIDNAPIILNDNAMLLDIRVVMIEVIGGNKQMLKFDGRLSPILFGKT